MPPMDVGQRTHRTQDPDGDQAVKRALALLSGMLLGLTTVHAAEAPPKVLDNPAFKVIFPGGAGLDALNEVINTRLANHPGMFRYLGFRAVKDASVGGILMPGHFTGTMEQLIKSIACVNKVSYTDFSPSGVTFVAASPEHPMPNCPQADTELEAKEHLRRPIPGFDDIITMRKRAQQPKALQDIMPTEPQKHDGEPLP
jgi:hypothetical protein